MKDFAPLAIALASAVCALAQTKSFEVASIKPTEMTNRGFASRTEGPVVTYQGFSVQLLVLAGLGLPNYRIVWPKDAPEWVRSERFDIVARAPGEARPSEQDMQNMMRSLLAERFGMKSHPGTLEAPIFNLVVDESGPKLKLASAEEPSRMQRTTEGWAFTGSSISSLASQALLGVDRPVFDKTGLTERYDFVLKVKMTGNEVTGADGESIFTALREQLGLRLEAGRDVLETFVIDHVERPSSN